MVPCFKSGWQQPCARERDVNFYGTIISAAAKGRQVAAGHNFGRGSEKGVEKIPHPIQQEKSRDAAAKAHVDAVGCNFSLHHHPLHADGGADIVPIPARKTVAGISAQRNRRQNPENLRNASGNGGLRRKGQRKSRKSWTRYPRAWKPTPNSRKHPNRQLKQRPAKKWPTGESKKLVRYLPSHLPAQAVDGVQFLDIIRINVLGQRIGGADSVPIPARRTVAVIPPVGKRQSNRENIGNAG